MIPKKKKIITIFTEANDSWRLNNQMFAGIRYLNHEAELPYCDLFTLIIFSVPKLPKSPNREASPIYYCSDVKTKVVF